MDLGTSTYTGNKKKIDKLTIQSLLPGSPSWKDTALSRQAHWLIYSKQSPYISSFRDGYFIEMLKWMVPPGYNAGDVLPILTEEILNRYIYTEYMLLKNKIQQIIANKVKKMV